MTNWDDIKNKFYKVFGFITRLTFITGVGLFAWNYFPHEDLGGVPLSQLTLNGIFNNLLAGAAAVICVYWFFHFEDVDYKLWANFGGVIISLLVIYFLLINK